MSSEYVESHHPSSEDVAAVMNAHWSGGYTSPNLATYPWMWLWDSCFHSIIWTALDDERAITELTSVFSIQDRDGFVPHMGYQVDPAAAVDLWGRPGSSRITQPPMYGHAIRVVTDAGFAVPDSVIEAAVAGLDHLWETRIRTRGLLVVIHPWETGCDDSTRWGSWMPEPFDKPQWDQTKRDMVSALPGARHTGAGSSPVFEVESTAFNALVAFNMAELGHLTGIDRLRERSREITAALNERWDDDRRTWSDGPHDSGTAPAIEALLPVLLPIDSKAARSAWELVTDTDWFDAPYGPRQTAAWWSGYDPNAYWRGPAWPQLSYLLWVAADRSGRREEAARLAETTGRGAVRSGLAEYWNPETGEGRGAIPQSWTGLALVMQRTRR